MFVLLSSTYRRCFVCMRCYSILTYPITDVAAAAAVAVQLYYILVAIATTIDSRDVMFDDNGNIWTWNRVHSDKNRYKNSNICS